MSLDMSLMKRIPNLPMLKPVILNKPLEFMKLFSLMAGNVLLGTQLMISKDLWQMLATLHQMELMYHLGM